MPATWRQRFPGAFFFPIFSFALLTTCQVDLLTSASVEDSFVSYSELNESRRADDNARRALQAPSDSFPGSTDVLASASDPPVSALPSRSGGGRTVASLKKRSPLVYKYPLGSAATFYADRTPAGPSGWRPAVYAPPSSILAFPIDGLPEAVAVSEELFSRDSPSDVLFDALSEQQEETSAFAESLASALDGSRASSLLPELSSLRDASSFEVLEGAAAPPIGESLSLVSSAVDEVARRVSPEVASARQSLEEAFSAAAASGRAAPPVTLGDSLASRGISGVEEVASALKASAARVSFPAFGEQTLPGPGAFASPQGSFALAPLSPDGDALAQLEAAAVKVEALSEEAQKLLRQFKNHQASHPDDALVQSLQALRLAAAAAAAPPRRLWALRRLAERERETAPQEALGAELLSLLLSPQNLSRIPASAASADAVRVAEAASAAVSAVESAVVPTLEHLAASTLRLPSCVFPGLRLSGTPSGADVRSSLSACQASCRAADRAAQASALALDAPTPNPNSGGSFASEQVSQLHASASAPSHFSVTSLASRVALQQPCELVSYQPSSGLCLRFKAGAAPVTASDFLTTTALCPLPSPTPAEPDALRQSWQESGTPSQEEKNDSPFPTHRRYREEFQSLSQEAASSPRAFADSNEITGETAGETEIPSEVPADAASHWFEEGAGEEQGLFEGELEEKAILPPLQEPPKESAVYAPRRPSTRLSEEEEAPLPPPAPESHEASTHFANFIFLAEEASGPLLSEAFQPPLSSPPLSALGKDSEAGETLPVSSQESAMGNLEEANSSPSPTTDARKAKAFEEKTAKPLPFGLPPKVAVLVEERPVHTPHSKTLLEEDPPVSWYPPSSDRPFLILTEEDFLPKDAPPEEEPPKEGDAESMPTVLSVKTSSSTSSEKDAPAASAEESGESSEGLVSETAPSFLLTESKELSRPTKPALPASSEEALLEDGTNGKTGGGEGRPSEGSSSVEEETEAAPSLEMSQQLLLLHWLQQQQLLEQSVLLTEEEQSQQPPLSLVSLPPAASLPFEGPRPNSVSTNPSSPNTLSQQPLNPPGNEVQNAVDGISSLTSPLSPAVPSSASSGETGVSSFFPESEASPSAPLPSESFLSPTAEPVTSLPSPYNSGSGGTMMAVHVGSPPNASTNNEASLGVSSPQGPSWFPVYSSDSAFPAASSPSPYSASPQQPPFAVAAQTPYLPPTNGPPASYANAPWTYSNFYPYPTPPLHPAGPSLAASAAQSATSLPVSAKPPAASTGFSGTSPPSSQPQKQPQKPTPASQTPLQTPHGPQVPQVPQGPQGPQVPQRPYGPYGPAAYSVPQALQSGGQQQQFGGGGQFEQSPSSLALASPSPSGASGVASSTAPRSGGVAGMSPAAFESAAGSVLSATQSVIKTGGLLMETIPINDLVSVAQQLSAAGVLGGPRGAVRGPLLRGASFGDGNGNNKTQMIPPRGVGKPSVVCAGEGMTCCVPEKAALQWRETPPSLNGLSLAPQCVAHFASVKNALCAATNYPPQGVKGASEVSADAIEEPPSSGEAAERRRLQGGRSGGSLFRRGFFKGPFFSSLAERTQKQTARELARAEGSDLCGMTVVETADFWVYRHEMHIPDVNMNDAICECKAPKKVNEEGLLPIEGFATWAYSQEARERAEEAAKRGERIAEGIDAVLSVAAKPPQPKPQPEASDAEDAKETEK